MNCRETKTWISPYLDSELDPTKTFEVSQHLERCDDCRRRFEREADADRLIGDTLRRSEAFVDWAAVERDVRTRLPSARLLPFRPSWMLGLAACLAFVIVGLKWSRPSIADNPAKWAIDELYRLSPNCEPFELQASCTSENLVAVARKVLGTDLQLSGAVGGHAYTLVEVLQRTCPRGGGQRLEVHLNCCGNPVLLTVGHCNKLGALTGLVSVLEKSADRLSRTWNAHDYTYHVCARKIGQYVVVAVSPHRTDQLVHDVQLAKY